MKRITPVLLCAASLCAVSCESKKPTEKAPVDYPTIAIDTTSQVLNTSYAASITGCQTVEIRPQVDGVLTNINIKEGSEVRNGQILFEIEPAQFQAAYDIAQANVNSAEAAVSTARLVLESNQELYKEAVISDFELNTAKNELAEAMAKLRLAKAELDKAATNLSYTQVKSPVNGVASMIPYRVGALVSPNITSPLVTVSDDAEIYAYFSLAENQMLEMVRQYGSLNNALKNMPEVRFRMSDGELYPHPGHIDAVSGTINNSTGAISYRAVFPNPDRLLRDGGTGAVIIPSVHKGCIVVPQTATFELQDKVFVYKVIDNKATAAEIAVMPESNGREYIVTAGLAVGDTIIAEGAGLIKEGSIVKTKAGSK